MAGLAAEPFGFRLEQRLDDAVGQLLREPEDEGSAIRPSSGPAESSAPEGETLPTPNTPPEREAQPAAQTAADGDPTELSVEQVEHIDTLADELLDEEETPHFVGELAEKYEPLAAR